MKRVLLFLATNLAVVLVLSVVLNIVYAVTEQEHLQASIDELSDYRLSCGPVVLAELASWEESRLVFPM